MIERYTRPEMGAIWTDEARFQAWLDVEIAVVEAQVELGMIPREALAEIKAKASFDVERIKEIELEVKHDVIAFLTNVNENVGDAGRYIHKGMTSSDVIDTALALNMIKAAKLIQVGLNRLHDAILSQAKKHKHTVTIGRSHGIHGEPTTFGFKMAVWLEEVRRHQIRLQQAIDMISVGKFSGAVGTFSNITPVIEEAACKLLGITAAPISTQIIQRDRHAQYVFTLALIGSSLDKFATEIRHLQRTDVLEAEEPFTVGQKGSSAMPHKRNPVGSENISGLARLLRGNAMAALENIPLWHERDISHSSVERIILPDSTILIDYMLHRFAGIMENLVVYPENMRRNMDVFGGVIFSQAVMLKLVEKGLAREEAYRIVQSNAHQAYNNNGASFHDNLLKDERVMKLITKEDIEGCLNPENYLKNIDAVFTRVGV
ncbi:adenylosuccinate lyase [Candidatus Obscuribacterales bacterium]|nr:adenylosuccinate lyase [Candidatus Obscuribacterales bacterium]MBX3148997.1 adenylosuccinate lyase [Candidatus Obscuribacterales bacterium]